MKHGCPNIDCVYRLYDHPGICGYFETEGVTRTFLHRNEPGVDINNPCREYKPGDKTRYTMKINTWR
jgi:hypothetical protein